MNFFSISFTTVLVRFYLMMSVIIIGVFTSQFWLAVFALPIFLSIMLGIPFQQPKAEKTTATTKKIRQQLTSKAA